LERALDAQFPNLRHLRVFVEVARCGSVSQAALRSNLSQPAVTQAVSKLEKQAQVSLFNRHKSGLYLSDIGQLYFQRVETALALLEQGALAVRRLGRPESRPEGRPEGRTETARGFQHFDQLMTAAQLRALVALSQRPNFTAAAKSIGLSQPSLHRAVRNLEALSGVELFRKSEQGIAFTPAALVLLRAVKLAWSELRQGEDEIGAHLGHDSAELVVGTLPLPRSYLLPRAIHAMVQAHPGLQIRSIDGPFTELSRALLQGDIDFLIGALRSDLDPDEFTTQPLFDDPLAVVAGRDHPLVGQPHLPIAALLDYPWIAPPRSTPAGSYLYQTLGIAALDQTPVRVVSSSLVLVRGLLKQGPYLTILSRHQIREELTTGSLATLDVDLQGSSRPIGLTFRSAWRPTARQQAFIACLEEVARQISARQHDGARAQA
jgi:DNA-binding transcriptional LysR family regulator